jgi:hypothetical protein
MRQVDPRPVLAWLPFGDLIRRKVGDQSVRSGLKHLVIGGYYLEGAGFNNLLTNLLLNNTYKYSYRWT